MFIKYTTVLAILISLSSVNHTEGANETNVTCDNNSTLAVCESKSACFPSCAAGTIFKSDDCESKVCTECRTGEWCDGTHSHNCPDHMTSVMGSTSENSCECHSGYTLDPDETHTCIPCPEGSWCNATHINSCPEGTTSQIISTAEHHCYCLPGYNGTIPCEDRNNATHTPCNVGYMYEGGVCKVCSPGYWCDGEDETMCDKGMTSLSSTSELDHCTCHIGYTRDQCTAVLTFTVTLAMTKAEFDATMQTKYIEALTNALSIPTTSLYISSIDDTTSARRLLGSTINVETTIHVPGDMADRIAEDATSTFVISSLGSVGITSSQVSVIIITRTNKEPETDNAVFVIIASVAGGLILLGITGFILVRVSENHYAQVPRSDQSGTYPTSFSNDPDKFAEA